MKHQATLLCILFVASHMTHAELNIPGIETQRFNSLASTDKTLAKTGLAINEDDITPDEDLHALTLTETQRHEALVWGLTEDEEKRYTQLMQNRSGLYYKGLRQTPIDILGINARDEAERNHFAEIASQQEAQKVSKNIAWNNAFYKAYNHRFNDVPVIGEFDQSPYEPSNYKPLTLESSDTLYWFIKPTHAIQTVLLPLIETIQSTPNTTLHLMLLDADDSDVQQWANTQQIPRELVATGQITLNHGELAFNALTLKNKTTPLLLLARNGASHVVDLGRF
jgi:integrating conjugative element protein (TIGR03759 family)